MWHVLRHLRHFPGSPPCCVRSTMSFSGQTSQSSNSPRQHCNHPGDLQAPGLLHQQPPARSSSRSPAHASTTCLHQDPPWEGCCLHSPYHDCCSTTASLVETKHGRSCSKRHRSHRDPSRLQSPCTQLLPQCMSGTHHIPPGMSCAFDPGLGAPLHTFQIFSTPSPIASTNTGT